MNSFNIVPWREYVSFCNIMSCQSQNAKENVNKIFRKTKNDFTECNLGPSTEKKKAYRAVCQGISLFDFSSSRIKKVDCWIVRLFEIVPMNHAPPLRFLAHPNYANEMSLPLQVPARACSIFARRHLRRQCTQNVFLKN